jgi:hypothetical protein
MWLITTFIAAICTSVLWYVAPKNYKLDLLSLMLWGASFMILVDHIMSYQNGLFLEMETEGFINNSILLGTLMLVPVCMIWLTVLLIKKPKRNTEWR